LAAVTRELDTGVDVNAATAYQSTALSFASDRGHLAVVELLLARGADPNIKDTFYKTTPLTWAQYGKHFEVVTALLRSGAEGADRLLLEAVSDTDAKLLAAVLKSGRASMETLSLAAALAELKEAEELLPCFEGLQFPKRSLERPTLDQLNRYEGTYALQDGTSSLTIRAREKGIDVDFGNGAGGQFFYPIGTTSFLNGGQQLDFEVAEGMVTRLVMSREGGKVEFSPSAPESKEASEEKSLEADAAEKLVHVSRQSDLDVSSVHWPGFRGSGSRGIADGQNPPSSWDLIEGKNVAWRSRIEGLGNSCPVVWGDFLYITSASSVDGNRSVEIGQTGAVDSIVDDSVYDFRLYCLNKKSGEIVWQRNCKTVKPVGKRHSKSSHANPTVATDGHHVVASFGSEGLYVYDVSGQLIWSRDLGVLDSGWFYDASYQWGFGSSPVIFGDSLFLQCDIQKGSFVVCLNLKTGQERWRMAREEIPTWSTPVVHSFGDLPMLITHGTRAARGYDARDGRLLWWLKDHSEIVVPTPNVAHDLIYLASGYAPIQPIIAVRPEARGELQLPGRAPKEGGEVVTSAPGIAWSHQRGGPYMPTPILYGDFLYACSNNGVVTCYRAKTGEQIYKKRLNAEVQSFTASPVAADGRLYFTAEDGCVLVVKAGGAFELISKNPGGTKVLATPAISDGMFFLRTTEELIAVREARAVTNPEGP
jgi:outer membrane protein assembly factor BamB